MLEQLWSFLTYAHGAESSLAIAPLVWAAIMAAASGAKAATSDKMKADAQRKYQAETARWSPWTGMRSQYVEDPDVAGAVIKGGLGGYQFGSQFDQANNPSVASAEDVYVLKRRPGAGRLYDMPE